MLSRLVNLLVGAALRSPFHSWLSGSLILITYVGHRSGVRHTLPVRYAPYDGELVVLVGRHEQKQWWRGLRVRSPVKIRHKGRWYDASAMALHEDADAIAPRLAAYLRRFPGSARSRGVLPGPSGEIDVAKLCALADRVVLVSIVLAQA